MPKRYINWPEDTYEQITLMRETGMTWGDVAAEFNCSIYAVYQKAQSIGSIWPKRGLGRTIVKYTAEEDEIIKDAIINYRDYKEVAQQLNRSWGGMRLRIRTKFRALAQKYPRNSGTQIPINKHINGLNRPAVQPGETQKEYSDRIRNIILTAKKQAKDAALTAKRNHYETLVNLMCEAIANGKDRNEAIFECRAAGVSLERIGQVFNITRERVRQIHDQQAYRYALKGLVQQNETKPDTGGIAELDAG